MKWKFSNAPKVTCIVGGVANPAVSWRWCGRGSPAPSSRDHNGSTGLAKPSPPFIHLDWVCLAPTQGSHGDLGYDSRGKEVAKNVRPRSNDSNRWRPLPGNGIPR